MPEVAKQEPFFSSEQKGKATIITTLGLGSICMAYKINVKKNSNW